MILTRMGNKRRLASTLQNYFPDHRMRIELFFGAGGAFFYLPKPKYSILNDLDNDVTNLYLVLLNDKEKLRYEIERLPIAEGLLNHWKKNTEVDPLKKAVRFLLLSNFTYLGKGCTLRIGLDNAKQTTLKNIDSTFLMLQNCKIVNRDFREVLPLVSFSKGLNDKSNSFVYLDPVYLGTEYTYRVPKWVKDDTIDCLDIMVNCGIKCAMSEFHHPFIVSEAKKRSLNVIPLKQRQSIKAKKTEILITNYDLKQTILNYE